ncbi:MAG: trans-sulfuration enzyme family protein [Candidatus Heimdallarchaeota archaeon]
MKILLKHEGVNRVEAYKFETKAVHAGQHPDEATGAIIPPIYQTATYVLEEIGKTKGYDYSRTSNPTRTILEQLVAALEGSQYGVAFASGMAAIDGIIRARLRARDHVVVCDDAYGGVYRLFEQNFRKYGLQFTYVDTTDPENVMDAIRDETRVVWLETPTNPLLKVSDLEAISDIVQQVNQQRIPSPPRGAATDKRLAGEIPETRILTVVDNTFMTPYFLQPFKWGADLSIHSTTKYLSGHNQLIGGLVVVRDDPTRWYYKPRPVENAPLREGVTESPKGTGQTELVNTVYQDLKFIQNAVGATPSPFDCWLTILGIKTLALRMRCHDNNARKIVSFLTQHPKVARVYYPGLEGHKNHAIAKRQMTGFGGIISFELKGGLADGCKLMNQVKLWSLAESLGAVESMITHPASMTHVSVPRDVRLARGITDGLVRLSVGIENVDDLIADLQQALEQI